MKKFLRDLKIQLYLSFIQMELEMLTVYNLNRESINYK